MAAPGSTQQGSEVPFAINNLSGMLAREVLLLKQHLDDLKEDLTKPPRHARDRLDQIHAIASSIGKTAVDLAEESKKAKGRLRPMASDQGDP